MKPTTTEDVNTSSVIKELEILEDKIQCLKEESLDFKIIKNRIDLLKISLSVKSKLSSRNKSFKH